VLLGKRPEARATAVKEVSPVNKERRAMVQNETELTCKLQDRTLMVFVRGGMGSACTLCGSTRTMEGIPRAPPTSAVADRCGRSCELPTSRHQVRECPVRRLDSVKGIVSHIVSRVVVRELLDGYKFPADIYIFGLTTIEILVSQPPISRDSSAALAGKPALTSR
jgi:hypothetical protein